MNSSHIVDEISQRLSFYPDANNNKRNKKDDKYSLRPRSLRRGEEEDESDIVKNTSRTGKAKQKPPPLSKYRRKTANARERSRMREINAAFEALRRCVPPSPTTTNTTNEKLTKITTLRLAMGYITTLNALLRDQDGSSSQQQSQDIGDFLSEGSDLDCLFLESDGESLPLSDHSLTPDMPEQCLTPINLNMSFDHLEQTLSPTFPDQSLSPFDSLFPDFS